MRLSLFAISFLVMSVCCSAQYLTNVQYELTFGSLGAIDMPYRASKTVSEGNYLYCVSVKLPRESDRLHSDCFH